MGDLSSSYSTCVCFPSYIVVLPYDSFTHFIHGFTFYSIMVSVMVLLPLSGCVSMFALMGLCFAIAIKDQHVNSFANLPAGAHKLAFPLVAQDTTIPDMGARAAPVIIVTSAFISLLYVFYYAQSLTVNLTFARLRKQNLQSKDKQRVKLDDVKYG